MRSDATPSRRSLMPRSTAALRRRVGAPAAARGPGLWSDLQARRRREVLLDGARAGESARRGASQAVAPAGDRRAAGARAGTAVGFRTLDRSASRRSRSIPRRKPKGWWTWCSRGSEPGESRTSGPAAAAWRSASPRRAASRRSARWMSSAAALALAAANRRRRGRAGPPGPRRSVRTAPRRHRFDAMVSNPPYLSDAEFAALDPSVKRWEPAAALVSGPDGLARDDAAASGVAPGAPGRRLARAGGGLHAGGGGWPRQRAHWAGWTSPFMPTYSDASATCSRGGAHQP